MPNVKVNGINLYYELHGPEDVPVLVLSNGIMMSTASWGYQTSVLAKHFRVLLYDCRGMWKSDHPEGPYTMEMHAEDLVCLLDALEIESAHIAGISYGAEISMVFALKFPERTKTLIVIDGVSQIDPLLKSQTYPWLMAAEKNDPELLLRSSYHMNFSEKWIIENQPFIDASVERFAEIDMSSFVEMMRCFYSFDITHLLPEIKIPVLVVVGELDLIKGVKYSKIIVDQVENCEFVIVPDAAHALCLEKPAELNTLIIGFLIKHSLIT